MGRSGGRLTGHADCREGGREVGERREDGREQTRVPDWDPAVTPARVAARDLRRVT